MNISTLKAVSPKQAAEDFFARLHMRFKAVQEKSEAIVTKTGLSGHLLVYERDLGGNSIERVKTREFYFKHDNGCIRISILTKKGEQELDKQLHELVLKTFTRPST